MSTEWVPPHPGTYIRHELERRGWTQGDLSILTGMSVRQISRIINTHAMMTTAAAVNMAKTFNQGTDTWIKRNVRYLLWRARVRSELADKVQQMEVLR